MSNSHCHWWNCSHVSLGKYFLRREIWSCNVTWSVRNTLPSIFMSLVLDMVFSSSSWKNRRANMFPSETFTLQYTLSSKARWDIFLPTQRKVMAIKFCIAYKWRILASLKINQISFKIKSSVCPKRCYRHDFSLCLRASEIHSIIYRIMVRTVYTHWTKFIWDFSCLGWSSRGTNHPFPCPFTDSWYGGIQRKTN